MNDLFLARTDTFDPVQANNRTSFVIRAAAPLVILKQPRSQRVLPGSDVNYFVDAQGVGALSYQWLINGAAVPDQTGPILTLFNVQNSASIQVQVSDAYGSILSSVAALIVVTPPQISSQPNPVSVAHGTPAQFSVQVDGSPPLRFQWRLNGANIRGETNPVYSIAAVTKTNAGSYSVAVANEAGVISSIAVPLICSNILRVDPGDNLASRVDLAPAGVNPFQGEVQAYNLAATVEPGEPNHADKPGGGSVWFKWTAPVDGIATFDTIGSTFDTLLAVYVGTDYANLGSAIASDEDSGGFFTSLVRFNVNQGQTYAIAVDGFADKRGNLVLGWAVQQTTQFLPRIIEQPKSQTVLESNTVTLTVLVSGSAAANFGYQWFFNGKQIPGATSSTFTIPSLRPGDVGIYWVQIQDFSTDRMIESRHVTVEIGPVSYIQSQDKIEDVFLNAGGGGAGFRATKSGSGFPPFISVALGVPGTQVMNNTNSTADIDCFDIGTASRWLGIITTNAPAGSILRVDTSGSAIATELAVYRFLDLACLQSLTCIHTNLMGCDTNGSGGGYSQVQFSPRTGGQYLIFADGL
ncbi:MAG: immunoglobulin domain-containing protein, partial [Bryobacteraceae bacterium]